MSKREVFFAIHNFREVKSLANNAKIRSSPTFLLIGYIFWYNLDLHIHINKPKKKFNKQNGQFNIHVSTHGITFSINLIPLSTLQPRESATSFNRGSWP